MLTTTEGSISKLSEDNSEIIIDSLASNKLALERPEQPELSEATANYLIAIKNTTRGILTMGSKFGAFVLENS